MSILWKTRRSHKSKPLIRTTKIRWEMLGLQDPTETSLTASIEDIRRQVISASNDGLSPDTLARSQRKGASHNLVLKAAGSTHKRGSHS